MGLELLTQADMVLDNCGRSDDHVTRWRIGLQSKKS